MNYDVLVEQLRTWSDDVADVVAQVAVDSGLREALIGQLTAVVSAMRDVADDLERETTAS